MLIRPTAILQFFAPHYRAGVLQKLRQLLIEKGESELARHVPGLMILDRCHCRDDLCATFYTNAKREGSCGPGDRNVALAPEDGMLILD
jgi:hypothetical protein